MPSDNAEVIARDTRASGHGVKKQPVTCRQKPLSPGEEAEQCCRVGEQGCKERKRASSFLLMYISKLFNT